jgi:hypothetical protein
VYQGKAEIHSNGNIYIGGSLTAPSYTRIRSGVVDGLEKFRKEVDKNCSKKTKNISKKSFYAGNLYDHYGHFVLESLSRLSSYRGEPVIVWSGGVKEFKSYHKSILKLFSLLDVEHIFIDGVVRFDDIVISDREYIIWDYFSKKHYDFLSSVNLPLSIYKGKKIWLTRSGFDTYWCEPLIELVLKKHGWEIVNPLDLSIEQQVSIFKDAKKIAGIEGTAFHNMIFSSHVIDDVTIFSRRPSGVLGNFPLISSVVNNNHVFIDPVRDKSRSVDPVSILDGLNVILDSFDLSCIEVFSGQKSDRYFPKDRNSTINFIRDLSLTFEEKDIHFALTLMEFSSKLRPYVDFMKKKISVYKKKIGL